MGTPNARIMNNEVDAIMGIFAMEASSTFITNNEVDTMFGILVGGSDAIIMNNIVHSIWTGISVGGDSCIIRKNKVYSDQLGIATGGSMEIVIITSFLVPSLELCWTEVHAMLSTITLSPAQAVQEIPTFN
jgi:hypothetical protein